MTNAPAEPISCRTFGEAAVLALELHGRFGHHHAAVLLDDAWCTIGLHVLTAPEHRVDHAAGVALGLVQWMPQVARAVLFSEVAVIDQLLEDDARHWHELRRSFADQFVVLDDWLHTDTERVRSMTISCDAEPTWCAR